MVAFNWKKLAKLDSVLFVYFDKDLLARHLPDCNLRLIDNLCSILSNLGKQDSTFYGTQRGSLGVEEVTSIVAGRFPRCNISPPTGVTSARVGSSSGSVSAALNVHFSSYQLAHLLTVSTTVYVSFSVPSGLTLSTAVWPSSAPPLSLRGDIVLKDLQGSTNFI